MKKLFHTRQLVIDPIVIVTAKNNASRIVDAITSKGRFWRVMPTTGSEVAALRMMEHQDEKYAPASGNGALLTDDAMRMIDAI